MKLINWIKTAFIAAFAAALVLVRVLLKKNSQLKVDLERKDSKIEIMIEQQKAKDEALADEPERIEENRRAGAGNRADRVNSMFDS